ncbi:MAG: porin family protein [Saonia sp.]
MKKAFLLILITFICSVNVNAQKIQFGAKAGINFATISGDNTSDIESITKFESFGLVAEIPLSEKFSFQPELMYSVQGFDSDEDLVLLDYLNLPLMGKYYVTKGLSLEAGPQIGYLLSAEREGTDVEDSFTAFDIGVNFGIGYKIDNGINFGARYNLGLSDINDIDGLSVKNRNGVFQLYIGYFFF